MMGIIFAGYGLVIPLTLGTALQKYQSILGTASAVFGLSYYVLISFFTWLMGFFHNGTVLPMPLYFSVLSLLNLVMFWFLIK